MMNLLQSMSTGLDVADMAWGVKCREEDLQQRDLDNFRRKVDDDRRLVDVKSQQLKAVSELSALVAGFAMVVMVEINIPEDLHMALLVMFGTTAALVIGLMLFAMLNCTLMLVGILKFDCVQQDISFDEFWRKRCSSDWLASFKAFAVGLTLFMALLAQLGWVTFHDHPSRNIAASIVTAVAALTGTIWLIHTKKKWGDFIQNSGPQHSTVQISTLRALQRNTHSIQNSAPRGLQQNMQDEKGVLFAEEVNGQESKFLPMM